MDTFIHYGVAAGFQAMQDSGLEITEANAERVGVVVGSGIGGLPMIEVTQTELLNRGPRRISPFFVPASIINMISGHLSIKFGLKGPNLSMVTACTTSALHRRGLAPDRIRRRRRDDRGRRGIDRFAAGHRRLCGGARAVAA
jgi:3-oxoacyl-(acyl-carrier-protein) synthase